MLEQRLIVIRSVVEITEDTPTKMSASIYYQL